MSNAIDAVKTVFAGLTRPGAQFELEETTIQGITYRSYKNAPTTLPQIYRESLAFGDQPFLVYEDKRYTFKEAYSLASKVASQLIDQFDIKKGDRVAIAMRNLPEWILAFMGITSAGAIAVPLNSWGGRDELEYGIEDSGAKVVFADARRLNHIVADLAQMDVRAIVVDDEAISQNDRVTTWQALVSGPAIEMPDVGIDGKDPAFILYTSGTTGRPKGALSSHWSIGQAITCGSVAGMTMATQHPESVQAAMKRGHAPAVLLALPLFHGSGLHTVVLSALRQGTKVVIQSKWDARKALELVEREKISTFSGAAKMIWDFLEHPEFDQFDTESILNLTGVGAAQPEALLKEILTQFPLNFLGTGYGMTECNLYASINMGPMYLENRNSVGLPYPISEIKVIGDDGKELAIGEVGEICIKSPAMIDGYWGKEEETAKVLKDGWYRSGDVGYKDEKGLLYVCDRMKDMVIRGGENIYCAEVEALINEHPAVVESAAFGVPHDRWGEELAVAIHLQPGEELSDAELQDYVATSLAKFKVPTHVVFAEQPLPKNAMQKVVKQEVRDQYVDELVQ